MNSKKIFVSKAVAFLFAALMLTACKSSMTPLTSDNFSMPNGMEVVAGKIPVTVNGTIPPEWFNKKAEVSVIPVLKYDGGEVAGHTFSFQGEDVQGNATVIPYKEGGSFSITDVFDYDPSMKNPELDLRFTTLLKGKPIDFPDVKVAEGINTTALIANGQGVSPVYSENDYQRRVETTVSGEIKFLIGQAQLRKSELQSGDLAAWKKLVADAAAAYNQQVTVDVDAYASPDGPYKINEKLAEQRGENTKQYLKKELKKSAIGDIGGAPTPEDWDNFKKLVEASDLQDKNLVISVLQRYEDPEIREQQIKNISTVYPEILETIMPALRRARLNAYITTTGKTDAELLSAALNSPESLNIEELLFAFSLAKTSADKESILQSAALLYPQDYRVWNDLGALYIQNGDLKKAAVPLAKAYNLNSEANEANLNLGLVALANNETDKAVQYLGAAAGTSSSSLNQALGTLYLQEGDYRKAAQSLSDAASNDAALANILNKDYSTAQKILDKVPTKDATTYYLNAIVAARTNNAKGVVSNLKESISRDASLKAKAVSDVEFSKYWLMPEVANILK